MKLSIRTIWFISVALLLGAVFFTGWVGFKGIENVNHRFTLVRNNNFRLAQVVSMVDKAVIKWDRAILNYVLTESPQKEHEFEQILSKQKNAMLSEIQKLSDMTSLNEDEKKRVKEFEKSLTQGLTIQDSIIMLSRKGKREEARRLVWSKLRPVIDDLNNDIAEFIELQERELEDALKATDERYNKDLYKILYIIGFSVVLVLFIFYFFSQRVVRGVEEIDRVVRRVSIGDFSARANVKSEDEIGFLASEINGMIEKRKEAEEFRDKMVNTVSHDLRTPLAIIKESIGLVMHKKHGEINEKQKKWLSIAENNTEVLMRTVNDLLDVARMKAGVDKIKKKVVDAKSLIKAIMLSFEPKAKNKGLDLKTNLPNGLINVYADADAIIRVLTNLVGNALKFTEKGYIEVSVREKENKVEICVEDTGKGISKEDFPKLFNKFERLKDATAAEGTGLGLFITKDIVEKHGGKIWVESEKNKGTKIIFTLPTPPMA